MNSLRIVCIVSLCIIGTASGDFPVPTFHDSNSTGTLPIKQVDRSVYEPSLIWPHKQLRKECRKFKSKSMRFFCQQKIASNPTIASMGSGASGYVRQHAARGLSLASPSIPVQIGGLQISITGLKCDLTCPTTITPPMSLSPSQMCTHEDHMRFPQFLPLRLCSCKGCIDPVNGKEDMTYVSQALTTEVTVLRLTTAASFDVCEVENGTCVEEQFTVSVGCHCLYPSNDSL